MNEKDQSLETLRGLAILLVVSGYVITHDVTRATHTDLVASGLRFFNHLFTPIRMPLFTVISAYLYAASPATKDTFKKLVTGKARRILIPFLAVSTIQYAIFSLLPMSERPELHGLYRVYVWPHEQLWFLYSIFEIFVIVGVLDAIGALNTIPKWLACLAASLVFNSTLEPTKAFSIHGINYLMPFFLMGYGMRRYAAAFFSKKMIIFYAITALVAASLWAIIFIKTILLPGKLYKILGLAISFSMVPILFHFRKPVPFLATIGYYAFGIHLFNRIVVSACRAVFENTHTHDTAIQFTTYMVLGVSLAIVMQLALERYGLTRKYILGLKDAGAGWSRTGSPCHRASAIPKERREATGMP